MNPTHYGNPTGGCQQDENPIQISSSNGIGTVCAVSCSDGVSSSCPADTPDSTSALWTYPRCQLFPAQNFCLLTCTDHTDCMNGAFCLVPSSSDNLKTCLYPVVTNVSPSASSSLQLDDGEYCSYNSDCVSNSCKFRCCGVAGKTEGTTYCDNDGDSAECGEGYYLSSDFPKRCEWSGTNNNIQTPSSFDDSTSSSNDDNALEVGLWIFILSLALMLFVYVCYIKRANWRWNCGCPYGIWIFGEPKKFKFKRRQRWTENPTVAAVQPPRYEQKISGDGSSPCERKSCCCVGENHFSTLNRGKRWTCYTCDGVVEDSLRIQTEESWKMQIEAIEAAAYQPRNGQTTREIIARASHRRGVTVEFLCQFTIQHNCWDWETEDVVYKLIKLATVSQRCPFADLASVHSGPSDVFVSHCWKAKWGTMVAAVVDTLPPSAFVWVDAFAVRQWPGRSKEIDFRGVVNLVSGVLVVSQSTPSLKKMGMKASRNIIAGKAGLTQEEQKRNPFFRIWCLVEIESGRNHSKPIVFKCGTAQAAPNHPPGCCCGANHSYLKDDTTQLRFMEYIADINLAKAS
jgi:hypothetical protein